MLLDLRGFTGVYCTDTWGKPCRYETDGPRFAGRIQGLACKRYLTQAGKPRALKVGSELNALRCRQCRNEPCTQSNAQNSADVT